MTKGIRETLDLPGLDDIISDLPDSIEYADPEIQESIQEYHDVMLPVSLDDGHEAAMDTIYEETLKHGRDLVDLGYNLDPARAPRMFEVAGNYFKAAMDAKNSKRDGKLKLLKLLQDQRKLDLDEKKLKHEMGDTSGTVTAESFIVEDRNEIIRRMRDQAKSEKE